MKLKFFQIDTFSNELFKGNPAAVVPLKNWLPIKTMQSIAQENNLSETAFFCRKDSCFEIRWFTPYREVDLCGHGTLAAAFVLFEILRYDSEKIIFKSRTGILSAQKDGRLFKLDFPSQEPEKCATPNIIEEALGVQPLACYFNEDYIIVYKDEEAVLNMEPNFNKLKKVKTRGIVITAPSKKYDFVSRAFFPKYGIDEDPVTGSAHTKLIPYWFSQTGKLNFAVKQVSKRGGLLYCEYKENRVLISGSAVLYLRGEIEL
jgi:PhzF family phenazine biosynthesis protein